MKTEPKVTAQQLVDAFEGHPHHRRTALWLTTVTSDAPDPRIPKPDVGCVTSFLLDVREHTPPGCFELAARLVEEIPACYATQAERDAYRAMVFYLRQGWYRSGLSALVSMGDRRSRWAVFQWMTEKAGGAQEAQAESPEVEG